MFHRKHSSFTPLSLYPVPRIPGFFRRRHLLPPPSIVFYSNIEIIAIVSDAPWKVKGKIEFFEIQRARTCKIRRGKEKIRQNLHYQIAIISKSRYLPGGHVLAGQRRKDGKRR
jgi:hypothetical protein